MSDNWNWTLSKLKREDWDFRPEVCREDDLESCWSYEYSRELTAYRNSVADSRRRNPDYVEKLNHPALDDSMVSPSIKPARPMRLGSAIVDALSKPPVPLAYRIHPQWPDTPFGLLKRTPRKPNPDRIFSYLQEDIGEFARKLIGRPDFLNLPKTLWNQESNSETIVFTIPWNYNNDRLKKGFDEWLTDNRPQGNEGDSRPKVEGIKKPTGAGSRPRQLRASLKALGAYRLLLCYGNNRKRAREHTDVCKVLGRDFYNNESGSPWTDAKRVASIDAKIASVDAADDLALLKVGIVPQGGAALPITASRTVNLGSTVATVGFPDPTLQGFAPKFARGEIASLSGAADDPRYFQISVPVQPGNSGGALVDERGNVVGIVSAKLNAQAALAASGQLPENVNYAVKSSFLLSFLESVPDAKLKTANTNNLNFEDVVKSAQKATVLVLVVAAPEPQTVTSASPAPPAPQRRQVPYKSSYGGVNSSQTIDSVLDDGNLIKLNDGSLWQVSPYDAADSGVWTSATEITVIDGNDPNYPYKLVNTDDNETVNAKLIRE